MTDAERLLLLVTADAVLRMAANPCAAVDMSRLAAARQAVDAEAFQCAANARAQGDYGPMLDWLAPPSPEPHDAAMDRFGEALAMHRRQRQ